MTTFYLIRHAEKDVNDVRIPGRTPGIALSELGRRQATEVAEALIGHGITALYSSPMERTLETAQPLADRLQIGVQELGGFHEIDFGDWSNLTLDELEEIEGWKIFNTFRSGVRIPNGETMYEVQSRFVGAIHELTAKHVDETVGIVSHSDPIKAALAFYLGMPLDLCSERLEIAPASVSIVQVRPWGPRVLGINRIMYQSFGSDPA